MANLYPIGFPDPQKSTNAEHYLCINPSCPNSKRPTSEGKCQACNSELILNNRYRVIDVLVPTKKT